MIKSINSKQTEIIKDILTLHCKTPIELDPTYSKGNFYKEIPQPTYKFDINPIEGVEKASATNLPLENESITTMMFDPPFLASSGPSLMKEDNSNKITKRFSYFSSMEELYKFYRSSLQEFHRILKPDGILIFKCQDTVSSGKQYISHQFILNEANKIGFYTKDIFILLAESRLIGKNCEKQKHCRKFHSYFLVFQKKTPLVFLKENI